MKHPMRAAGDLSHQLEQMRVVRQKVQEAEGHVLNHRGLAADAFIPAARNQRDAAE
jgi:hypothetical protein